MTGQTPIYGIHYPDHSTKLRDLGVSLATFAGDVETALQAADIPPAQQRAWLYATTLTGLQQASAQVLDHGTVTDDPDPDNNGDYRFDGTNWILTAADTGWQNVTAYGTNWSGFSASGWHPLRYRVQSLPSGARVLRLNGAATKSSNYVASETICTLPIAPQYLSNVYGALANSATAFSLRTTGVLALPSNVSTSSSGAISLQEAWIALD